MRSCAFSPNGKLLLTSSADSTAILWEVATQRVLATYKRGDSGWVGHCVTGGRGGWVRDCHWWAGWVGLGTVTGGRGGGGTVTGGEGYCLEHLYLAVSCVPLPSPPSPPSPSLSSPPLPFPLLPSPLTAEWLPVASRLTAPLSSLETRLGTCVHGTLAMVAWWLAQVPTTLA